MANKQAGYGGKVVAVLFTSLVAPFLVTLAVRLTQDQSAGPRGLSTSQPPAMPAPTAWQAAPALLASPPLTKAPTPIRQSVPTARPRIEVTEVIVQGVGHTPEEALQDALHTALRRAVAAQVGTTTGASSAGNLGEPILQKGGLILDWRELASSKEWRLRGTLHHKEVAVELDRCALAARLRAAYDPMPRQVTSFYGSPAAGFNK